MPQFYDTMLAEYLKNPGQRGIGLDALATSKFEYSMIAYKDITGKGKIPFSEVALSDASIYSWEDVYMTAQIYKKQQEEKKSLDDNNKLYEVLEIIELPLMQVLKKMELTGIHIDRDKLKGLGMMLENEISSLEKEIHTLAGEEFNIQSPKQVGEILFEKLWLPSSKKTKTGFSVNAEVLEGLAKQYPIAEKIVTFRHYSKLRSTYVEGLLSIATEHDRVHTNYNQTIAATGRLSSVEPNLQNIPVWDGVAGEIRAAFIPDRESDFLVAFDYSQVEVRLLALMSGDENLLDAFKQGKDIHQVTAEFVFGKKDITTTERKFAKAVNFGVIYGISPFGLTQMIPVSQKEARVYIDKFYENYPKVREFFDKTIADCEKNGYVETMFGRRRYIGGINDRNAIIKKAAEREAINMPIQGTSADIIKIAMIRIADFLEKWSFNSKMLLQVHDELVFNVVSEEKEILEKEIPKIMEHVLEDRIISLKVDMAFGKNWKECK